ncbi:MAG: polysaccharide deacetylase family protein, partial [Porphyrobacter sp.]|nr:polysaccharide deacetylase family protein [Porphyrobacter sp.]
MNDLTRPAHAGSGSSIVNGLSVDIEDWFQVGAFEKVIERDDWNSLADRVERNLREILDLFDAAEVKATFFALGRVARRHGGLMHEIVARGHELASHGWDNGHVFRMDRKTFAEDLARARQVLEDAAGVPIRGYRAPGFSIDRRTPWAFMELAEQGYAYSSSVAPLSNAHFGWADAPRFAFRPLPWSPLLEIPVTTAMFAGKRLLAAGGGFFRVIPYAVTRWAIRQVNACDGR